MSTATVGAEQRVILDNISWSTYLAILDEAGNRRGRITYDQGVIEIMSPSMLHEAVKRLLARMIEAYTPRARHRDCQRRLDHIQA